MRLYFSFQILLKWLMRIVEFFCDPTSDLGEDLSFLTLNLRSLIDILSFNKTKNQ